MTDYIEWNGGPMPVDADTLVDVVLHNREHWYKDKAKHIDWKIVHNKHGHILGACVRKYRLSKVENT